MGRNLSLFIMEKQKWRKLKIKPRKVNGNVQQHHEDYFLVQSVYMDVLIKKQFYDDVNKQKIAKINDSAVIMNINDENYLK